ncbi:glycoside hydrolase family 15 protein [Antarcticirhabdus aurantiaca]|uniref:Glycoside hydrolase family 15 protein n=1 Tax=Antarcticirhabdus aurantiaca TaxID=2606717 RepID=A0ACD4NR37_9HYPH|nr:glycoside hydrolase family 15 protein [Antarcticirhabdus aurantiaca]WAJ29162.1 glycoside hydrolase family 15 protein [Jeongeuplla avenae]
MDGPATSPEAERMATRAIQARAADRAAKRRADGFLPLRAYAALGDGRSVALVGGDGSIDWWCVPNIDSPALFDRILDEDCGGCFVIAPTEPFSSTRSYRENSNVLETEFATASGRARLVEALNSGSGGRLPWCELARRVEGLEGTVEFEMRLVFGTRADTICPYLARNDNATTFHVGDVTGMLRYGDGVEIVAEDDSGITARIRVSAGTRETVAIIAGENEPLVSEPPAVIDARIDTTDAEWRQWCDNVAYDGERRPLVIRSALALKLLLYSPTGAIAAAATTSLPEGIGGAKNYDYRYAWVRDASYTIKAFMRIGAMAEAKAAFTWLIKRLAEHGPRVCFALDGRMLDPMREVDLPGYRGSRPVLVGNQAADQFQQGIFGDIFETAKRFVAAGHIIDPASAKVLSDVADICAEGWRRKDAGIWELEEYEHYTMSKISAWQALARAVELADGNHIPSTCRERWARTRDRIAAWIDEHCWSQERQAYTIFPGSTKLDASLALAVRFGFDGQGRLEQTLRAIDAELRRGEYHYRYHGVENDEGCFLACSFWVIEGLALLGHHDEACGRFDALLAALDPGCGILPEMVDPQTGDYLGNMPQGLSHLALIQTAATLSGREV